MDGVCLEKEIHGSILAYLGMKKDHFYSVENTVDGKFFVTARGWEDLSEILKAYEELGVEITENLIGGVFMQRGDRKKLFCQLSAVSKVRRGLWPGTPAFRRDAGGGTAEKGKNGEGSFL